MTVDFDTLWHEYESELTAFVRARLFDKSLASDIMQEVAIKIYKNKNTLAELDNTRAWLYRVTRNTLIDFYKKNDKTIPEELYSLERIVDSQENDTDEMGTCLTYMMSSTLSQSDNEILHLSVLEEYSLKEIATKLNLTLEGTKSKLKRAKKKLSSSFFECCSLDKDVRGNILDFKAHDEACRC